MVYLCCWYRLKSMWLSTLTRFPVPALATQPNSNSPCGSGLPSDVSWKAFFFFLHVFRPLCQNNTILDSSVHCFFFKNEAGFFKCASAHCKAGCGMLFLLMCAVKASFKLLLHTGSPFANFAELLGAAKHHAVGHWSWSLVWLCLFSTSFASAHLIFFLACHFRS